MKNQRGNINPRIIDGISQGIQSLLQEHAQCQEQNMGLVICSKLINLMPDNGYVYYYRGYLLDDLGRYKEALESFNKAIAIDATNADFYSGRGDILSTMRRLEEAVMSCDISIALDASNAKVLHYRGLALYDLGRYKEALKDFVQAIKLEPSEEVYYVNQDLAIQTIMQIAY